MKKRYILNRTDFIKENNDNINKSIDGMSKFGISTFLEEIKGKLSNTNDLWQADKIGAYLEDNMDRLERKEYDNFYRVTIPEWVDKFWMKGMTFNGDDLNELLNKRYRPEFEEYLKGLGYNYQEAFVSYGVGSNGLEDEGSSVGTFKIAYDIFKENESGWILFEFHIIQYGRPDIKEPVEFDRDSRMPYINFETDVITVMKLGDGTFYSYKIERPYDNLADYFGDGGYILRKD